MSNKKNVLNIVKTEDWGITSPFQNSSDYNNPVPMSAFNQNFQKIIEAAQKEFQVPKSLIMYALLGAMSTLLQGLVNAPMGHSYMPVSLFLLTQVESGGGKTSITNLIYKRIFEIQEKQYHEYIKDLKGYNSLSKEEKNGLLPPKNPIFVISSATLQFILRKFINEKKLNLAWVSGEAGLMLGSHSMKPENIDFTLSSFADFHGGLTVEYNTAGNSKESSDQRAYGVRLTINISGQPVIIESIMTNDRAMEQGFLARFLLSFEPSLIGKRVFNNPERISNNIYENVSLKWFWDKCEIFYKELINIEQNLVEGKPQRFNMPYASKAAHQFVNEYKQECENRLLTTFKDYKETALRLVENCSRIATLFAFFDGHKELSVEYLERGKMITEYSINELLRYQDQIASTQKDINEILINFILRKCRQEKVNGLYYSVVQSGVPSSKLRNKDAFKLALDVLVDKNYIKIHQINKTRFIEVNPEVLNLMN